VPAGQNRGRPAGGGRSPAPDAGRKGVGMANDPVFDQFNLVVGDMAASVAFYRLVGFDIPDSDEVWDAHHRTVPVAGGLDFDLDSTRFASQWDPGWRGGMGVVGVKVASRADVDARHEALTGAGYRSQLAPTDAFWGARYAIVEDPDGNAVGIMSPVDPAMRSEAPTP
jgi:catechol 2,3-dioxygenase-like lactoylglutathione lyase family enzyme